MTQTEPRWVDQAAESMDARFSAVHPWPWRQGLWTTIRTDYSKRAVPPGFDVRIVEAAGARRRLLLCEGSGTPLLILVGLYASLDEGLFTDLAVLAAKAGRRVALLEDRLGGPTLALSGGEVPGLAQQARELVAIAESFGQKPDVLALSAGVPVALTASAALARIVGWSGAVDPVATARTVARNPVLHRYYQGVHRRAFARAGLTPPPIEDTQRRLMADAVPATSKCPFLLVHAGSDPVAPVSAVQAYASAAVGRVVTTAVGGHLGFGVVLGNGIYLEPLT